MKKVCGWIGHILRVNLSTGRISTICTLDYVPQYIGGRGIAARIAWDELPGAVGPFDPENLLLIMTGPLTGTLAPASGRSEFFGVAPQVYPRPWFTRSGMGGWFGSELKYAGFDGIIIEGKAEKPVYLWINDQATHILSAEELWGRDTYSTQRYLIKKHGPDVKVACIGPAGENLVRYAVILSETKNAAGGGGLGAVMGSKKLKAIVVKGSGSVKIAKPKELLDLAMAINEDYVGGLPMERPNAEADPELKRFFGLRGLACSHACPWRCGWMWREVPAMTYPTLNTTLITCLSNEFIKCEDAPHKPNGDWYLGKEGGVEIASLANKLGLNHWSLIVGLASWLTECKKKGIISQVDELKIDMNDPKFWVSLLEKIAYRQGMGDILAEEVPRASEILGKGEDIARQLCPAYGFAGHWDGHGDKGNPAFFPLWIVSALQWATDTRDPFGSGHGYTQNLTYWSRFFSWKKLSQIGKLVYGSRKAIDPEFPYQFKAQVAIWHQHESVIKDSLPLCDQTWPRLYSLHTEDNYARVTIPKYGTIEGKSFEAYLYSMVTGIPIDEKELRERAEAIFNLERALQVRNYARSRKRDEAIIPYFEIPENIPGPSGKRESLDREKFLKLMDKYYQLRGWDEESGWPKIAKLRQLGLEDVADDIESLSMDTRI